jgi:hypothetical protein
MPLPSLACLAVVKVLGQALISGTLFSYVVLFSLCGTALSVAAMWALCRLFRSNISRIGISTAGSFFSNAAQLALARFFLLGKSAVYIGPPLLIFGVMTGVALGVFCELFMEKSRWYRQFMRPDYRVRTPDFRERHDFKVRLKSVNLIIVFFSIVLFNLFPPYGRILLKIGPFAVTQGALLSGLRKALMLQGLVVISKLIMKRPLHIRGFWGGLLSASFAVLGRLNDGKTRLASAEGRPSAKTFIERLDAVLLDAGPLSPG